MAILPTKQIDDILPSTSDLAMSRLQARLERLLALQTVARDVTSELDLDRLLHKILRAAIRVMKCSAGSLLLYDRSSQELVFEVVEGGGGAALERTRIPCDKGIAGAAFKNGQPVVVDNAAADKRHLGIVAGRYGLSIQALIAVPLIAQGETIGVLEAMNKVSGDSFDEEDQDLLLAFASQSAIAITNARLYQSVIQERDRILSLEEGVRREVIRNLHDGPAQILTALIMTVRFLRDALERAPDRAGDELLQLEALGQKALYQVRNILFDLRPVILEADGLGPALEAYVERLRLVEPFNIEYSERNLTSRFKPNVESVIFSTVQEAVNNARRHAGPHRIWIDAQEDESHLTIQVRDDGSGFDVAAAEKNLADKKAGHGLLTMRQRTEVAQGELRVDSLLGRGTVVTLRVPLTDRLPDSDPALNPMK